MAQTQITDLPQAQTLTGFEAVPIVQNGVTVQTTTGAIAVQPTQTQTFLTATQQPSLPNSRYLATGSGLQITDNGSGSTLQISLTGAVPSLNSSGTGIQVKTDSNTLTARQIQVGTGLGITNPTGVAGNPIIALGSFLSNVQSLSGSTGLVGVNGGVVSPLLISGVSNQISVTNPDGSTGNPTVGIASNPVLPGTASVVIPNGTTAQRNTALGAIRYNTDYQQFEGYSSIGWSPFSVSGGVLSFSGGTTGLTPSTATTGAIVLGGILVASNGGTGASSLTGYVKGNGASAMTASPTVPTTDLSGTITNAQLANSSITIGSSSVSLGSSLTTLLGVSISGSSNTLTNIGNSSLTNSTVTIGTTPISLGATSLTLAGLTSVTVTQDPTTALQLATKQYVDSVAQGLNTKAAVLVATTANITLSGEQTIDGFTTSSSRVLVKNQSLSQNNGIYVSSSGAWTRSADANTWNQLISAYVFVEQGTINADTGWVCTVDPGGTLGTTPVTWAQFSGAGTYTAGTGLTLTGTQFSITNTAVTAGSYTYGNFTVNAQGQLTSATSNATPVTTISFGSTGFTPSTATSGAVTVAGTLVVGSGGTGLTSLTAGYIPYGNGTGAFASNSGFTFTGTSLTAPTLVVNSTISTTPNLTFNASNSGFTSGATVANSYLQTVIQNKSGTSGASTNYVVSNDLGTDSTYYGEFGMNSSTYTASGTFADFYSINNGIYLSGHDGDISLGSGNGYKTYLTWGTSGQSAHVINASGAIGFSTNLGTSAATTGTSGFGTAGQVATSNGPTAAPTWSSVSGIAVTTISFGTTGLTPATATNGAVTVAGTLNLANGGTGATTVSAAQTNLQVDPAGTAVAMAIALG